ncbi:MAG: phage baseplate assembly protein V, partial [Bacteroidota bacterium]
AQFGLSPDFFSQQAHLQAPAAGGLLAAIPGLQIGVVTQLEEDPEGEERIKVKLPIISADEEGIWARLATLDAGNNRGTVFRPEVDDEVIVGFVQGDPRDAVILGMLHSSAKPSPIPATADNHEKGIISRSEVKILFDDEKSSLLFETPGGNQVLISDDEGGITLADQHGNKIILDSDGIALESAADLSITSSTGDVKIEGMNIEHAANTQFKAEGSAGLEISSSAITVVKGSLVQIN